MTKQHAVELLQNQLPGFYSVEQVINLINQIDESTVTLTDGIGEEFIQNLLESITGKLDNRHSSLVDLSSAEFDLNGNEIFLESVDVDTDEILERCENAIRPVVQEFFQAVLLPKQA